MHVVRPVAAEDVAALEANAAVATPGVHTLPRTRDAIARAVEHSLASFAAKVDLPSDEAYMFVLEADDGSIVGSASISATSGSKGTFFAFRNDVIQQVSRDLDISHSVHALTLCSDLTSHSQLSSFYMRGWRTAGEEAALLSRARLLFAATAPHRFADRFFASLAGVIDESGRSPFWEALGRKFFHMDFLEVERMIEGARNRSLIVELMPHYPVYVPLLPGEAQAVMGQVHGEGELPFHILSAEGFEPDEFIDIFDGGPILQSHRNGLRAFSGARHCRVLGEGEVREAALHLVCNGREDGFRAVLAPVAFDEHDGVSMPGAARQALDVAGRDPVSCISLL